MPVDQVSTKSTKGVRSGLYYIGNQGKEPMTPTEQKFSWAGHQTALKIIEKSWSSGANYHVGQKGLNMILTHKPGWITKTESFFDEAKGYYTTRIWLERTSSVN